MTNGWFVGNFDPVAFKAKDFEVAFMNFVAGQKTQDHHHKIATEINLIVKGYMVVNGLRLITGDIFIFAPNEISKTEFLEDTSLIVVKTPSIIGDKYND